MSIWHWFTVQCGRKVLKTQMFKVLGWLGNSPDPNPIENFWELANLEAQQVFTCTIEELVQNAYVINI